LLGRHAMGPLEPVDEMRRRQWAEDRKTIVMQISPEVGETEFLLKLTEVAGFIGCVGGWP